MSDGRVLVNINLMRLFEWDKKRLPFLPPDPTPERLLEFLCTPGLDSTMKGFKARYRALGHDGQELFLSYEEPMLVENLFWPLRHAKTSYLVGNFVGCIALCGLIGEKIALLTYAIHDRTEAEIANFEDLPQSRREAILKEEKSVTEEMMQAFGSLRATRGEYLHRWNAPGPAVAKRANEAYQAAIRLVTNGLGMRMTDEGAVALHPRIVAYLRSRGAFVDVAPATETDDEPE